MSATLSEIVEKISDRYDPDEIIDILCISTEDILNAFTQDLLNNLAKFEISDEVDRAYETEGEE
jgi:hypothetical protein|tara:strand:- start:218 stop:409 length:192 start_codon:yes stop_codon:yes gene_type:complete